MRLQKVLKELTLLIDPNKEEWINIFYGNTWEFQFYSEKKIVVNIVAEQLQSDLLYPATKFLLRVQEFKKI